MGVNSVHLRTVTRVGAVTTSSVRNKATHSSIRIRNLLDCADQNGSQSLITGGSLGKIKRRFRQCSN